LKLGFLSIGVFQGWIVLFNENILNKLHDESGFTDTTILKKYYITMKKVLVRT